MTLTTWLLATNIPTADAKPPPTREGVVRRNDTAYTLVGPELKVGDAAPTGTLRGPDLAPIQIDFADGKTRVVTVVPSLDTPTCSTQTRTFNADVADLGPDVDVLVVSRDLPFAQARFCGAHGIERVVPLSDYESGAWGTSWGLYIQETALLARAVYVVDSAGKVTYREIVENVPDEPNYAAALEATKAAVGD